jgi:hypothetical protein
VSLLIKSQLNLEQMKAKGSRSAVVVAGPGSSSTIPGLIVSEIVQALARTTPTTRIEVNVNSHLTTGLHRAPSLSAAFESGETIRYGTLQSPSSGRHRGQFFRKSIGRDVATVVAYAWPGIDNSWIKQATAAGRAAGAVTVVACASLPQPSHARASSLGTSTFEFADVVLIGDEHEAVELRKKLDHLRPDVKYHPSLSLDGRSRRPSGFEITAFLPKDDVESLRTLLAAFDAFPEASIHEYKLHIVMRYNDRGVTSLVNDGYHRRYVELVGDQMSATDLEKFVSTSSAISVVSPERDSRAFSTTMASGVGAVVIGDAQRPQVGRGYVGGLMADVSSPASIHVALSHALRIAGLRFPSPSSWDGLAQRLSANVRDTPIRVYGSRGN